MELTYRSSDVALMLALIYGPLALLTVLWLRSKRRQ
jgi:hypothetical protein